MSKTVGRFWSRERTLAIALLLAGALYSVFRYSVRRFHWICWRRMRDRHKTMKKFSRADYREERLQSYQSWLANITADPYGPYAIEIEDGIIKHVTPPKVYPSCFVFVNRLYNFVFVGHRGCLERLEERTPVSEIEELWRRSFVFTVVESALLRAPSIWHQAATATSREGACPIITWSDFCATPTAFQRLCHSSPHCCHPTFSGLSGHQTMDQSRCLLSDSGSLAVDFIARAGPGVEADLGAAVAEIARRQNLVEAGGTLGPDWKEWMRSVGLVNATATTSEVGLASDTRGAGGLELPAKLGGDEPGQEDRRRVLQENKGEEGEKNETREKGEAEQANSTGLVEREADNAAADETPRQEGPGTPEAPEAPEHWLRMGSGLAPDIELGLQEKLVEFAAAVHACDASSRLQDGLQIPTCDVGLYYSRDNAHCYDAIRNFFDKDIAMLQTL
ncbi:hypothetical protein H632_c1660p0 [Helicosporidium sp. ATCC 50920]|nr:hypothetical protein H632_c1660p0 [Helicosporidium sp. ATCC 50920]|eukprot:KDD74005.1 hypothetical protein H632_c1660p0 [Helicosporidium sp. ATCC 50920]